MPERKIILFEWNEVPFRVLDDWCARNPHSWLARHLPAGAQYETFAPDTPLSPWITWPTLHRGVVDHGLKHFGQDVAAVDRRHPPLWRLVADHGKRCGVFGSLHTYPLPADVARYAFYVPDPFAPASDAHPAALSAFQDLNLRMSRQSARNVSTRVPVRPAASFAARAPGLGLRAQTVAAAVRQLADEVRQPHRRVRRRTFQSVLAFDLFFHQLEGARPDFATFFTNHVASAMHRYWAARYPEDYETMEFDAAWRSTYRNEIDSAMAWSDRFLARLGAFVAANPEYGLWIASSMGQAATTAVPLETQLYMTEPERFMTALGLGPGDWSERPAMAPERSFFVAAPRLEEFRRALGAARIDARPIHFSEPEAGFFMIALGHENLPRSVRGVSLGDRDIDFAAIGLENVAIEDHSTSSAYHVPEGMLWIHEAGRPPDSSRRRLSTLDLAPAILDCLSVPRPAYMQPQTCVESVSGAGRLSTSM